MRVSVIIPVYNARDYIIPCVESLVNQSLEDIELLFVDDHGSDDSMDAVRRYAEGYSGKKQFRFLETPSNSGPGVARNIGIEAATGEYIAFVDSDDWIERDFCESLYKAAARKNADLSWCDLRQDNLRDGSSRELTHPRISSGDFNEKKHKAFLTQFVSYFWTFLYRREFLVRHALRFPGTSSSEDTCFLTCCILAARRIATVEKPLYHYVLRSRSLSTKVDPGKYRQKLRSFEDLLAYARRHDLYEPYKDEMDFIYVKKAFLMAALTYVANAARPDPAVLRDELYPALLQHVPAPAANKYVRKSFKVRKMVKWIARRPRLALWVLRREAKKRFV
ncbi:MAG: glycosyltransferase family 2 protein [Bacteroidales bacterium]|nr:glycosyltransferase family 2 protein [Bacteroidales bacterium]